MHRDQDRILLIVTKADSKEDNQFHNYETDNIKQIFNESNLPRKYTVLSQSILDWRSFQRFLLKYSPEIVHYPGYRDINNEITDYIVRVLGTDEDLRCVFLNAPFTDEKALLISQYVDFTIGYQGDVDCLSAIDFAIAFYDAISFGRDFQSAYEIALITYDRDMSFVRDYIVDAKPVFYNKNKRVAQQDQIRRYAQTRLSTFGHRIVGRNDEIRLIDNYWESNTSIVIVEAWGGVGKTSLASEWRTSIINKYHDELFKVFDWSFSKQGEEDNLSNYSDDFVEEALKWFDVLPEEGLSSYEIGKLLAAKVQNDKNLVILDGVEVILSSNEHNSEGNGIILDEAISAFLMSIAEYNNGLCIVTTRRHIKELERFSNCQVYKLENLDKNSSQELINNMGIYGDDISYKYVFDTYKGHPLSLSLLCGYVRDYLGGDLDAFVEFDIYEQDEHEKHHASNIMKYYDSILNHDTHIALLRILSLFDRPVRYEEIQELVKAGFSLTKEFPVFYSIEWGKLLRNLKNAQLLTEIRTNNEIQIDLHPMVRDYYQSQLKSVDMDAFVEGNSILYNYLNP